MQVLTLCELGLKTPIHAPKMGFWGDVTPKKIGNSFIMTPNRHFLARKHVIWCIDCQNRSTSVGCARAKNKVTKKKLHQEIKTCDKSRIRRNHPRCHSATWMCLWGHSCRVVIYSKFHWNPFGGFRAMGGGSKFGHSHNFGYWPWQQLIISHMWQCPCNESQ